MPVRSLNSSVLKWVTKEEIEKALKSWIVKIKKNHPEVKKIGLFGSYAKGNWGVGSDLDILIVVEKEKMPIFKRPLKFDTSELPLPADVLVYTEEELENLKNTRFFKEVLEKQIIWLD